MTLGRDDWLRAKDVFARARALPASDRQAYLSAACVGNEALRQEVESLLASDARAKSFLESPAVLPRDGTPHSAPLMIEGRQLGAYHVEALLGAGGMGDVFKARDTRLGRTVAIKLLPRSLRDDSDLKQRFEREAKTLATLSHPHICAVFDVGHQDGIDFLVMEHLEGETLADRLRRSRDRRLQIDEAITIASQIASALVAVHRAGIVHRDLKPGNVMLTRTGAKLLDFGIAKSSAPIAGDLASTPPHLTAHGTILGTVEYMSPEQIEGKEADARTDLFACGLVLFEMVTGRRAFEGDSAAGLMGAILEREVPLVSSLQPLATPTLDRIVSKCLAKDPDERWQSAKDLCDELKWIAEGGAQIAVAARRVDTQARSRARTQRYGWIAAAVFLLATLALAGALYLRRAPIDTRVYRSTFVPPGNAALPINASLALSPDGRRLAFVAPDANGRVVLWVRELAALASQPLGDTEGAAGPFWSPDSRFIAFSAAGKLKKIDASGGPAISICDTNSPWPGSWGRGDVILFTPQELRPISRVAAAGGTPTLATTLDTKGGEKWHAHPFFLPDGRHFLYAAGGVPTSGVYVGSLDSPDRTRLLDSFANAQYASGFLVFPRDGTLMAQPFDATRLALSGQAMAVAEHVNFVHGLPPTGTLASFVVSDTGDLVFEASRISRLVWFDRAGRQTGSLGEPARYGRSVHLSPDGRQLSVDVIDSQDAINVWLFDLARGVRTPLTTSGLVWGSSPSIWSPDGGRVVFTSRVKVRGELHQKASSGAGPENVLLANDEINFPESWSADGRFLLYMTMWGPRNLTPDIWVLPLFGDRKPSPFIESPYAESGSQFSPDGHWVAYNSNESGRSEVYVVPFPGPGGRTRISTAGGGNARWRRDGKEIFYLAGNTLMAASVTASGSRFDAGAVQRLFEVPIVNGYWPYDVSSDGQRFLVNTLESAVAPLTIVVNWPAALKR